MVRPVDVDARGIVTPDAGLRRFDLERFPPSPHVGRFVAWYWVVSWDLRGRPSHTQHVFAHPVVNVTFQDQPDDGLVTGVTTRMTARTLSGEGRALGVMFRPAGFRPLLGRPLAEITDTTLALSEVLDAASVAADLAGAVLGAAPDHEAMAAAADAGFAALLPEAPQPSEDTTLLVERVAAAAFLSVEDLAADAGTTSRQLQRLFADHVGVSPKAVIRRYRLYEAAERARQGESVDWATIAAELGYSDQAHLTRDFTASFGLPPGRYLRANNPDTD